MTRTALKNRRSSSLVILSSASECPGLAGASWAWLVEEGSPPRPHLTEDEHPPELAASPVSCQLLLDLLCGTKQEGEKSTPPPVVSGGGLHIFILAGSSSPAAFSSCLAR